LVGVGSNLGDREGQIAAALAAVARRVGPIGRRSRLYETEPVGAADLPFLNGAVVVASALAPEAVMAALLAIEAELGRVRRQRWENRVIDLDILLWAKGGVVQTLVSATVTVPHPHLLERPFALVPGAEVAPSWRHPATGKTLVDEVEGRGFVL